MGLWQREHSSKMSAECERLEDQLAGLFVEAFGDGNEGTLDELIYAFVARVLSEEECERLGIEGGEGGGHIHVSYSAVSCMTSATRR